MTDQLQLDVDPVDDPDEEPEPVIPRPPNRQMTELPGTTWEDIFE